MGFGLMIGFLDSVICVTTLYNSLLHTHTHTHISVHSHVCTSRCSAAASNSRCSPSSGFSNCPRPQLPAFHSNSSQWLNLSSSLTDWLTHSVTHQPTNSKWLTQLSELISVLLITSWHGPHRKHCSSIAVYGPLPSNGCLLPSNGSTCHNTISMC
jgi:hypothetical protein